MRRQAPPWFRIDSVVLALLFWESALWEQADGQLEGDALNNIKKMDDGAAAATVHWAADHHHGDGPSDDANGSAFWSPPANGGNSPVGQGHNWDHSNGATGTDNQGLRPGDQVVFVDSQIANYQAIVAAINPGVKVIVYDGAQDGLAQIARDLQGVHDLASVDIVSHGAADEVVVGTDTLTTSTIPTYAADLAAIGSALAPTGQLDLYGCDVAAAGDGFLTALQQATGRDVAASTDPIGASALGGTWTLDATTGPTPDALPANPAELQSFDGLLLATPAQISFVSWNGEGVGVGSEGNMVEQLTANGSTLVSSNTVINDGGANPYPALLDTTGFVADTALNEYFVASYNPSAFTWTIQEGSFSGGGLTTLDTVPFPALNSNFTPGGGPITGTAVLLGGLALDNAAGELYFAQDAENYQTGDYVPADTGIYKMSVTGGPATLLTSTTAGLSNPLYLTLDKGDNLVFFDDSIVAGGGFPAVNNLDVANLTTGAVTVLKSFTSGDPNFMLQGLAVDPGSHTLYLATADLLSANSASNAILSMSFSVSGSGSAATASVGPATTLYSGSGAFQPTDIVVDPQAGIFYTTGSAPYTVSFDGSGVETAIFEGSLTGGAALNEVFAVSSVLPPPSVSTGAAAFDTHAPQLFLSDVAPVLTAGATVTFDGGESPVTLDSGLTIAAGSSTALASATVTLASGKLSSDILSFNGGTNRETFSDGDQITASYSAGVLTLSGTAMVADYQTALEQVQFGITSNADPTNDGGDTSRTIDWSVNDGTANSNTATSTLDAVHVAPTVVAGANVNFGFGGSPVILDGGLTVSDADSGGNLSNATISIGTGYIDGQDTLSFTSEDGITGAFSSGVLNLSGTASLADYQAVLESVTFDTTSTITGSRIIDWVVGDGVLSSAVTNSTVDVAPCYCPGTLIKTGRGQKRVEKLKIGDKVMTASGALRRVKWVGRRSYSGRFMMGRNDILPICIKAGALEDNLPKRDLWISPHHAMYFGDKSLHGVLIEAKDLVNGVSIVQDERAERVEYFHIELDSHDVIIAEGALSESFVDDDSRGMFHNAHEYQMLYPAEVARPTRYCAPRLSDGYEVEVVRRRIARRAGLRASDDAAQVGALRGYIEFATPRRIAGWAQNIDQSEAPVCLDVYAGGVLIGQTLANRYREDLQRAGIGSHGFDFTPPAGLDIASRTVDVRRSFDGAALEFLDIALPSPRPLAISTTVSGPKRAADAMRFPKITAYRRAARAG